MEKKQKEGTIRAVSPERGGICFGKDEWWNARGAAKKEIIADLKGATVTLDILDETKRTFNFFTVKGGAVVLYPEAKEEKVEDSKPSQETKPMTNNDYWKNKEDREINTQKQIHRNGCINSAIAFLNMYGEVNQTEKNMKAVKELAEDISKWIKEKIK